MANDDVLIAGGGIGGLVFALTCHQVGVPCVVYESVRKLRPMGLGINLQPNAVRELHEMGLADELDTCGVPTEEWTLFSEDGTEVWVEPRGRAAGYDWPQYSVHRGQLQVMLYRVLCERLGHTSVHLSNRVMGFEQRDGGVTATIDDRFGGLHEVDGRLLVAADGLHSAVRAQMFPDEGAPCWEGIVMWRGATMCAPIRTGASFVLVGNMKQRFVCYPIARPDPKTGLQLLNWIAETRVDPSVSRQRTSWTHEARLEDFLPAFSDWVLPWLNIPDVIRNAHELYEFNMVDRDPAPHWTQGAVTLLGDAAHPMYPVGSNGATQAILDARVLGAAFLEHGVSPAALMAYEDAMLGGASRLVLLGRESGPVGVLGEVAKRQMSDRDIAAFMEKYRVASGVSVATLNAAPPTIAVG